MTDPIYEYVKGEGWVPNSDHRAVVRIDDGRTFYLTVRKPVPGERVMQIRQYHPTLATPFGVYMPAIIEWFQTKKPRMRNFYQVPRRGYMFDHHTVVVEDV